MKKAKRLVSFITATAFLLSSVAPGFAADATTTTTTEATKAQVVVGKDVKGTKYEKPVAKLVALSVLNGKDNDGNVKPEDTITRAEFAKILVTELNMGTGVAGSTTKFKDVPASHWASGYIALATGKGLIKGYPGGAFKPEAPVTYAEAATMVVRMLGYAPAVDEKAYPASYLSKAASIGISDGISVKANDAAKRGDVFIMAANALDTDIMEQDDYGTETIYRVKEGETILSEEFDITVMDSEWSKEADKDLPTVNKVPRIAMSTLKANEIEFAGLAGTYEVAKQIDPNQYLGEQVELWVDQDDDVVYYLATSDDQEVINDTVDKFDGDKIYLNDKDDDYDIVTGDYTAKIWANMAGSYDYGELKDGVTWTGAQGLSYYDDAAVKVILNDDDKVTGMVLTDYYPDASGPSANTTKSGLVKEVKTDDETIEYFQEGGGTDTIELEDADYAIYRDGVQAQLSNLAKDDIINVIHNDDEDEFYIVATSTTVKGKVEKSVTSTPNKVSSYDITIDGKKYDISEQATISDDANKSVDAMKASDAEDLEDETITAYLDVNGDVRHVSKGTDSEGKKDAKVAIVTKGALYNPYDDSVTFEAVNESGTELKWSFDVDDVDLNGNDVEADIWESTLDIQDGTAFEPIVIEYDLDSAGKLSSVDVVTDEYDYAEDVVVDEDDDTVTLDDSSYNVVADSVFFDVTSNDFTPATSKAAAEINDVKTAKWEAVESKDKLASVLYKLDDDEVEYMFVLSGPSLGSDAKYGIIKGFGKDKLLVLTTDNEEKYIDTKTPAVASYVYGVGNTVGSLAKGQFIRFETNASDEIDDITVLGYSETGTKVSVLDANSKEILGDLDLEVAKLLTVTDSSSTSIKGTVLNDDLSTTATTQTLTVNSNTKYFEIFSTDSADLKKVSSVSNGDTVLVFDTDDDGKTLDFVLVIKEK